MNKAYKFRIYPTEEQKIMFAKTFGCVRFIYNRMLSDKIAYYKETGQTLNNTPARYKAEFPFLKEVDSMALANAQINLQSAYKNFFRNKSVGFPKFKSKKSNDRSYTTNVINGNIRIEGSYLRLPKVGEVKIKQHRSIPDGYKLKSVTVRKTPSGKYFASLLFEYSVHIEPVEPETFIGMDYSMHELYVDSNGNEPCYPKFYRQSEDRLAIEQRKLSHMKIGSKNCEKQRIKVANLHEKVSNQRKDFLHKLSRQITNDYDCVCIEDLNMKGMAQSLHFGKSVCDNGWGMFTTFLQYKLSECGKHIVKVGKFFPSSQLCHVCGYQNKDTKNLSVRSWICPECHTVHNRDVNAAINIREEGKRLLLA